MKKFLTMAAGVLRSVFWGADPARHAFFALTLCIFTALTVETWYFLTGMTEEWLRIFSLLSVLLFLIAWVRLCCHLLRPRSRFWSWLVAAICVLWVLVPFTVHPLDGKMGLGGVLFVAVLVALWIVTAPCLVSLIVFYRQWRWLLLRLGCFALGAWLSADIWVQGDGDFVRPGAWIPVLAHLEIAAWLALGLFEYWLTAKIYADAAGIPWRRMFGKGVFVVIGIFLLNHLLALGGAVERHFQAERGRAALEKHFGASLSPRAMAERYYAGRAADAEFWKRALAALKEVPKWIRKDDFDVELHGFTPPPRLEARGGELDASPGLRKLEAMFSAPPPAFARDYDQPMLKLRPVEEAMRTPQDFGNCELARVCRAVAERDKPTALAALRRFDILRDFLIREDDLYFALVMTWNEWRRLHALEWLIGAEMLDESELLAERRRLEALDAALEQVEFDFLRAEAGEAEEFMDSFVNAVEAGRRVPYSALAWSAPSLWYIYENNRILVNRRFMIRSFSEAAEFPMRSLRMRLATSVLPGRWHGKGFRALSAGYRAMEGLIDAAL